MRIAAVDGLADEGVRLLEGQGHEVVIHLPEGMDLGDALAGFDAVIVRSATQLDEQTIRRAGQGHLRAIGRAGVGVDNIDVTALTDMGIPVVNAPAASTNSVVELALGHLLRPHGASQKQTAVFGAVLGRRLDSRASNYGESDWVCSASGVLHAGRSRRPGFGDGGWIPRPISARYSAPSSRCQPIRYVRFDGSCLNPSERALQSHGGDPPPDR